MTTPTKERETLAGRGLFAAGTLLLVIAIFTDPLGPSAVSGAFDLGVAGTKWLLGGSSFAFLLGGIWTRFKHRASNV